MPILLATEKGRSFLHMKISKEQSLSVRLQFFAGADPGFGQGGAPASEAESC